MACLLGLGNGLFHIGGGLDILDRCSERAAPLGLFVSPGALGVFLGTMLGKVHFYPLSVLTILLLAALSILCCVRKHRFVVASFSLPHRTVLLPATLLFCVVVLRSFGGTAAQFPWKTGIYAWFFVFAVVAGKALGGILADRFGSVRVSAVSLLAASICFLFGSYAIMGLLALLMFNMTMPITLLSLSRKMPGTKGFSFGLLTFALFLGFLPFYLGAKGISSLSMVAVAAASALLLLPALKEGEL